VVDRFIQQAILQILTPLYDPTFSPSSYGFRPGKSAHQAVEQAREHVASGKVWVVPGGVGGGASDDPAYPIADGHASDVHRLKPRSQGNFVSPDVCPWTVALGRTPIGIKLRGRF